MPFLDDGLNQAIGETIAGGIQAALRGLRTRIDAGPLRVGTNARNVVRSSPKSGPPQLPKCRSPAASPGGGASVFLGGVEVGSARAACLWRGGHGRRRTSGNRSSSPAAGWWRRMRASCPATGGCWTRTRWSRSSPGSGRAMTHARANASPSAPPSSPCAGDGGRRWAWHSERLRRRLHRILLQREVPRQLSGSPETVGRPKPPGDWREPARSPRLASNRRRSIPGSGRCPGSSTRGHPSSLRRRLDDFGDLFRVREK